MKIVFLKAIIVLLCLQMSIGCATIIHGSSQNVQINSSPDEAEIWIDGAVYGKTPARINLERKHEYLVTLKKDGYKEASVKIESKTSAWIIGNVIFGGLIGCGIDLISGGAYELGPERLDVNLTQLSVMKNPTITLPEKEFNSLKEIRFVDAHGIPEIIITIN